MFAINDVLTLAVFSSSESNGFEDDWKRKKIENTTELKTPVTYGAVVPVRCVTGYQKISGPDVVTCIESTNFYELDDVKCHSEYKITFLGS